MTRALALMVLFSWVAVAPQITQAFEPPGYDDPDEAVDSILAALLENDRHSFQKSIKHHFDESADQIESLVFDTFLTDGESFEFKDRLQKEELGKSLKRYTYLFRTWTNDMLYIRIQTVKVSYGWIAYDLDIKSDLSRFYPDWDDP